MPTIGRIANIIRDDAGPKPGDDRNSDIYRARTASGDTVDVR